MSFAPHKDSDPDSSKGQRGRCPIFVRHILGDIFKSRRKIRGAIRRRALRQFLALLEQLSAFADNFICRIVASASDLIDDQALNVRA
jgi:hypothetical protein